MSRLVLGVALLLGCGGRYTQCRVPYFQVASTFEASCGDIADRILLTHNVFVPTYMREAEFVATFDGVPLSVEYDLPGLSGLMPGDRILVEPLLLSLAHEMFHVWDVLHLRLDTVAHAGWAEKGYLNASEDFKCLMRVMPAPDWACVHGYSPQGVPSCWCGPAGSEGTWGPRNE
jgi:hypothetical protein